MAVRTGTELERLIERAEKKTEPVNEEWRGKIAQELGKMFQVLPDEVAVLELSAKRKSLKFVLPEKLSVVGTIPLSSMTALAARTARDRRGELFNNFGSARHASVFEGIALGGRTGGTSIQKIISVPILENGAVAGVAQISRKGDSAQAGPDFTLKDLRQLEDLTSLLARFLRINQDQQKVQ